MPILSYLWLVAPLVLLCLALAYSMRRASRRQAHQEAAHACERIGHGRRQSCLVGATTEARGLLVRLPARCPTHRVGQCEAQQHERCDEPEVGEDRHQR